MFLCPCITFKDPKKKKAIFLPECFIPAVVTLKGIDQHHNLLIMNNISEVFFQSSTLFLTSS